MAHFSGRHDKRRVARETKQSLENSSYLVVDSWFLVVAWGTGLWLGLGDFTCYRPSVSRPDNVMSNQQPPVAFSLDFGGGLLLLFIGLKLAGVIQWSWFWVFAPIWIPAGLAAIITLIVLLVFWLKS